MAIGVMPVTGIPLPFVSYGGSAMLVNLAAVGLVGNVQARRSRVLF
jgi:rod shape determining protein RodA